MLPKNGESRKVLRPDLERKKEEFEALGWKFERDPVDEMWSAQKGDSYIGKHAYFSALIAQIEGEETGIHEPGKYSTGEPEEIEASVAGGDKF